MTDRRDEQDIAEVLVRYATGIDRRDWELFRTCWAQEVDLDYGDIGRWRSVDEVTAFMEAMHADLGHTLHRLSNLAISVEGDEATARTYVDAVLMSGDGGGGLQALGFYDDELVRTPEGWRIRRRTFTSVRVASLR